MSYNIKSVCLTVHDNNNQLKQLTVSVAEGLRQPTVFSLRFLNDDGQVVEYNITDVTELTELQKFINRAVSTAKFNNTELNFNRTNQ